MTKTHGKFGTKIYTKWASMKSRCYYLKDKCYKDYGGRGIIVCKQWKNSFESFYDWAMKNGYQDNLELDRINNNGNYEPNNCRFITQKQNANNKRTNRYITYNGETKTISQWTEYFGYSRHLIKDRLRHNWTEEEALSTPPRKINDKSREDNTEY